MEQLIVHIEGQVERLIRRKDDLTRDNSVLRRENERLRKRVAELTDERDLFDHRIRLSTRHVETALSRLKLLSEDL